MTTTEAWVLHRAGEDRPPYPLGELRLEEVVLPEVGEGDVLVEPLYGCWEANMTHALERTPLDIVAARGEERIVLGNAGLVRVLHASPSASDLVEGDICFLICASKVDRWGYVEQIHGYDGPGTMGLLAKRAVIPARSLARVPPDTRHDLRRWATYARYWSAWSNWRLAYGTWRLLAPAGEAPYVLAWGGGVSLAQCELAQIKDGAQAAMTASSAQRLDVIRARDIRAVDRSRFSDLAFDAARMRSDPDYRAAYHGAESRFLAEVEAFTEGRWASIVIDNIGGPVYRASLKALGRGGVLTTCGWKQGMELRYYRAIECISRHQHIHTHAMGRSEFDEVVAFQEEHGWLPQVDEVTSWEEIGGLSQAYAEGQVSDYFPVFAVNPL